MESGQVVDSPGDKIGDPNNGVFELLHRTSRSDENGAHHAAEVRIPYSTRPAATGQLADRSRTAKKLGRERDVENELDSLEMEFGSRPSNPHKKRKVILKVRKDQQIPNTYNLNYHDLLNFEIRRLRGLQSNYDISSLSSSQIGAVTWTPEEKESLFSALASLGTDNTHGIAFRLGNKTELEVQDYLQLLNRLSAKQNLHGTRNKCLFSDIPAALEISDECCNLLENEADNLRNRQERHEEKVEEAKWGPYWLLNPAICHSIQQQESAGESALTEILPAACLLNVEIWLELSNRIFMNSSTPNDDSNWNDIAKSGEEPGIWATTFEDFHSIAVSFTKRLVAATIFCRHSRERAARSTKQRQAEVSAVDVIAASKILGLQKSSAAFWAGCARRCNLNVVNTEELTTDDFEAVMTYKDVESMLSQPLSSKSESEMLPSGIFTNSDHQFPDSVSVDGAAMGLTKQPLYDLTANDDSILDFDSDVQDSNSSRAPRSPDQHRHTTAEAEESRMRSQDELLETFDTEESRLEETRLRIMLNKRAPGQQKLEHDVNIQQPSVSGYRPEYFSEWRANFDYWSLWEVQEARYS